MLALRLLAVLNVAVFGAAFGAGQVAASDLPGVVAVVPGQSAERIDRDAVYLLAPSGTPMNAGQALAALDAGQFSKKVPSESGASLLERDLWMAIALKNTAGEGQGDVRRVLGLGGIFVDYPRVYLAGDGAAPTEILGTMAGEGQPLVPRYFTYIRTQSFDLSPGATRIALINTHLNDRPTLGVFREGELGSRQIIATLIKASFTLTLLVIGIVLAVISILTRRWLSFFVAIGFGFVMIQVDTSLYSTAFASTPQTGRMVWEIMTVSLIFYLYYVFLFAFQETLRLRKYPWLGVIAILLPLPLIWIAINSDATTDIIWAIYIALILHAVTIGMKLDIDPNLRRLTMILLLLCVLAAILVEPYYLGRTLPDLTVDYIRDAIRLTAGFAMLIVVLVDVRRSSAERVRLANEKLAAMRTQAETNQRLLDMERSYSRAKEAATRRKHQLAAASHDIRQPLVGLRSALNNESGSLSTGLQARLGEAIDYLEHLTNEYSDREGTVAPPLEPDEAYSLDLIVRAVRDMFGSEAQAAGITFTATPTDCQTDIPALALIRATSNLVANALRHAQASTITLTVEHQDGCVITVRDDGQGMDEDTLSAVQARGAKGAESDGDGLGLAIVHELAHRHGFTFELQSSPGQGTAARLYLSKP